jgi:hypothetical protein
LKDQRDRRINEHGLSACDLTTGGPQRIYNGCMVEVEPKGHWMVARAREKGERGQVVALGARSSPASIACCGASPTHRATPHFLLSSTAYWHTSMKPYYTLLPRPLFPESETVHRAP